jgi:hypothetical protein
LTQVLMVRHAGWRPSDEPFEPLIRPHVVKDSEHLVRVLHPHRAYPYTDVLQAQSGRVGRCDRRHTMILFCPCWHMWLTTALLPDDTSGSLIYV